MGTQMKLQGVKFCFDSERRAVAYMLCTDQRYSSIAGQQVKVFCPAPHCTVTYRLAATLMEKLTLAPHNFQRRRI